MSTTSEGTKIRAEDAVEALLEQASPRPAPPSRDEQAVRQSVHAEWQAITGQRRKRTRLTRFAIAATVLLAVAVTFNTLRVNGVAPVQVAAISKNHGSIHLLSEQSELEELQDFSAVYAGQLIVTGSDAGIGLDWGNGGSLRIDKDTRIEFVAPDRVYLHSGQIYFDSRPGDYSAGISAGSIYSGDAETVAAITGSGTSVQSVAGIHGSSKSSPSLIIETDHGTVTHLGTQYITYTDSNELSVSVREGEVEIDGAYHKDVAGKGQRMTLQGTGRPVKTNVKAYGDAWDWIENTAPVPQFKDKTVREFLGWVSHETGLAVEFDSAAAEALLEKEFRGTVNQKPKDALSTWMMTIDLDWELEGGVIKVSATDAHREP